MAVPPALRRAMAGARRVLVLPGASAALALWAPPGCVVAAGGGPDAPASERQGGLTVWLAPQPPAPVLARRLRQGGGGLTETALPASVGQERTAPPGNSVILTRPWSGLLAEASACAALGLQAVPWPLSAPAPAPQPDALRVACAALAGGRYAAVGVASERAAVALVRMVGQVDSVKSWPPVACVGAATARALTAAGVPVAHEAAGGGAAMAHWLAARVAGGRVLLAGAEGGRSEAAAILADVGCAVDSVAAYAMIDAPFRARFDPFVTRALDADGGDGVYCTWFSPRAVERGLRALGDRLRTATWVVVGETTAAAARAAGPVRGGIHVAARPDAASVRETVLALCGRSHRGRGVLPGPSRAREGGTP